MAKTFTRITIDPGAGSSGWAIWDKGWKLLANGLCRPKEKKIWEIRAYENAESLKDVSQKFGCTEGYIEYPAFFQAHGACGVANSGALVKLAFFVGLVCGTMPFPITRVEVGKWKGQLPKEVVIQRIKRILPDVKATADDYDAIGIGLFLKGDLK